MLHRTRSPLIALLFALLFASLLLDLRGASDRVPASCAELPAPGHVRCHRDTAPVAVGLDSPVGLHPDVLKQAYGFPTSSTAGRGQTIAVVTAFDLPLAEADLNTFSREFGLPECTTKSGCFRKVDQNGGEDYPPFDAGWAGEAAMDIQIAHAFAPGAKILLVEARSTAYADMLAAVAYAAEHAAYVSGSWGSPEFYGQSRYNAVFQKPGVSFFFSSGDDGFPAYPSASPYVISVGGSSLVLDPASGAFQDEVAWHLSGGGCSLYEPANFAQLTFDEYGASRCRGRRAIPDLVLNADASAGMPFYISLGGQATGWYLSSGTSMSAPMAAGYAATLGHVIDAAYIYQNQGVFRDIDAGENNKACVAGFDLCAGRGGWIDSAAPQP